MASKRGPAQRRTHRKVITILSIDAGGIRGIIPAVILSALEAELQGIDGPDARIVDYFDVIAGTSTGSIVAALLTTPSTPCDAPSTSSETNRPRKAASILEFYEKHGLAIFAQRERPLERSKRDDLWSTFKWFLKKNVYEFGEYLFNTRYDVFPLQLKVKEELGEVRVADTLTNVVIPAYDIGELQPVTFSSHKEREKVPKSSILLQDAVLGSAAAPTYFQSHCFEADGEKYNLVDGGMAAYNPTLVAICEANKIYGGHPDKNRYIVVSIGTGIEKKHSDWRNLGSRYDWLIDIERGIPPLVSVLFDTSVHMVDEYTSLLFGAAHKSRHQFLRIQDDELKIEHLQMDNATEKNFKELHDIAKRLLDKKVSIHSSWNGIKPKTTNREALKRFAEDLSKIRGDAAKNLFGSG